MIRQSIGWSMIAALAVLSAGCGPDKPPAEETDTSWSDSQRRALNDPMNYRPEVDRTDISGGGLTDFDREGFKRDMDSLLLK